MADELVNKELIDFQTQSGLDDSDYIVVVLSSGAGGKISKKVAVSLFTSLCKPTIQDGYWWIGGENTEVVAAGLTPEFRKGSLGIEWKYTTDYTWKLLVAFSDIKLKFSDLTDTEKDELKCHFSDLTEDDIAVLQQPAKDMIAQLQATENSVKAAESARVTSEQQRERAEENRQTKFDEAIEEVNEALQKPTDYLITECEEARDSANEQATYAKEQGDFAKEQAEHPPVMGEDGYWYNWDSESDTYVKTERYARGDVLYPTFRVGDDMNLYVSQEGAAVNQFDIDEEGNLVIVL